MPETLLVCYIIRAYSPDADYDDGTYDKFLDTLDGALRDALGTVTDEESLPALRIEITDEGEAELIS